MLANCTCKSQLALCNRQLAHWTFWHIVVVLVHYSCDKKLKPWKVLTLHWHSFVQYDEMWSESCHSTFTTLENWAVPLLSSDSLWLMNLRLTAHSEKLYAHFLREGTLKKWAYGTVIKVSVTVCLNRDPEAGSDTYEALPGVRLEY